MKSALFEGRRIRRLGKSFDPGDAERLHRIRLAAKRARYTTEFLVSLAPAKGAKDYLAALKQVQECFGASNDATFAEQRLATLKPPGAKDLARSLLERRANAIGADQLHASWSAFAATTPLHVAMGYEP
ncbi:MAG: CHAD domain-containing protein [Alphaproteobacteria bacterium]|nr:CHAD domain-containing protein [Alphaproteobacteria bacterium]